MFTSRRTTSDSGIATGLVLDYVRPSTPPDLTYGGEDIIDKEIFFSYTTNKDLTRWEHASLDYILNSYTRPRK